MNVPPRRPALTFVCALVVFVLAVSLRFWYVHEHGFESDPPQDVWQVQGRGMDLPPTRVTDVDLLVFNLKRHGIPGGFRTVNPLGPKHDPAVPRAKDEPRLEGAKETVADVAPLYPVFRAGIELFAESYKNTIEMVSEAAVRHVQMVLGSLTCVLYFLITLRAFGNHYPLALLVGLVTAIYPFWVINTAELDDGTLVTFLLALALSLGVRVGHKGGGIRAYLFGVVLAGLALTRAALLPFAVIAQLWFFLRCRRVPNGGLCALLTLLGFASGMTPWMLWSMQEHGKPVPIVSTAWFHLWVGNNPAADGSDHWSAATLTPGLVADLAQKPPGDRYEALAPLVLDEITQRPEEMFKRRIKAALQFVLGITYKKDHMLVRTPKEILPGDIFGTALRPVLLVTLASILIFALLGWRWAYGWRYYAAPLTLAVYWVPLPYILSHAGPLHSARLPLDGVFIVLAVVGFVGLLPAFGARLLQGEERPATK